MESSLVQDSEETIHSAEKKIPHMKAKLIFSWGKTKKKFFEKPKHPKQKLVIFKLHQYPIYHFRNGKLDIGGNGKLDIGGAGKWQVLVFGTWFWGVSILFP